MSRSTITLWMYLYSSLPDLFSLHSSIPCQRYGAPESRAFREAQCNFIDSLAGYSLVTYLLQIKVISLLFHAVLSGAHHRHLRIAITEISCSAIRVTWSTLTLVRLLILNIASTLVSHP